MHPEDAPRSVMQQLRLTNIQHGTWLVWQLTPGLHGILLKFKLIYSPIQSLGTFTNNNKVKIGPAGLRMGCLSWWCMGSCGSN